MEKVIEDFETIEVTTVRFSREAAEGLIRKLSLAEKAALWIWLERRKSGELNRAASWRKSHPLRSVSLGRISQVRKSGRRQMEKAERR